MTNKLQLLSYAAATAVSWLAVAYLIEPAIPRLLAGKTVFVVSVVFGLVMFSISLPFYIIGWGAIRRWPFHLAYWFPCAVGILVVGVFGYSYVP
jgi:hypothetical protein